MAHSGGYGEHRQRAPNTEWGSPEMAELYDHETDPGEFRNLATDPAYRIVVQRLQSLLSRGPKAALPD